jgi:hypothetical protein
MIIPDTNAYIRHLEALKQLIDHQVDGQLQQRGIRTTFLGVPLAGSFYDFFNQTKTSRQLNSTF